MQLMAVAAQEQRLSRLRHVVLGLVSVLHVVFFQTPELLWVLHVLRVVISEFGVLVLSQELELAFVLRHSRESFSAVSSESARLLFYPDLAYFHVFFSSFFSCTRSMSRISLQG